MPQFTTNGSQLELFSSRTAVSFATSTPSPQPCTIYANRSALAKGGGEVQAAASLQHCLTSSFLRYTQNHIAYIFTNIHPYIPAYTFIFYERLSVSGYDQNFLLIGSAKRGAGER